MQSKMTPINERRPVTRESLLLAIEKIIEHYGDKCHVCGSPKIEYACMACERAVCGEHHSGGMICTQCQQEIDNMPDDEREALDAEIIAMLERGESVW